MGNSATAVACALAIILVTSPREAVGDDRDDAIALARTVAEREFGIAGNDVRFVQTRALEWPDSSLGCPEKGVVYRPAVVAGYEVILMTDSTSYAVHVAGDRAVVCNDAGTPRERGAVRDKSLVALIVLAREAFAARLGDEKVPIRVVNVLPASWPDTSLGCPQEGVSYAQAVTPGYVITLESGNRSIVYHAGDQRVVACAGER